MNRAVETRVFENLNKYVPIVDELGQQHPEFSRTIELVKLAVNGLSKYYTLFILDQHRKLINTARLEDDYSRNVTLIGREVKTWAGNPDLTLTGKKTINRLYLVLERCLRDALELYTEAERELWRQGGQIRMSAGDAHGEYERAKAALWKFQYDFHLHQIDPNRGTDRAIIYDQSGFSGPPAPGFVVGGFAPPDWQKPDDDRVRILTHEEQVQLKSLLDRPEVQKLIFSNPRNPAIIVISDDEDDNNDDNGVSESSVPVRRIHPLLRPRNVTPQRNGILKTPRVKPRPDKAKKSVRFGPYRPPPLPTYTDDDGSSRNSSTDRRDPPPRPPPTIPSYTPPPPQRPNPSPIVAVTSPTDESSESGWTSPPTQAEPVTEEAADPQGDQLGLLGPVKPRNKRDTSSSAVSSSSSSSSSSSAPASTRATCGDLLISIHTHSSPSSSPSLPSVGELSPTAPAPPPKEGGGDSSVTCSPSDEGSFTPPGDRAPRTSEERPPAQTEEELRREEVALNARAYLGPRHDEYSLALPTDFGAAIPAPVKDETEDEDDSSGHENSRSSAAAAAEDVPYDHEAYTAHDQLGRVAGASTARDVKATALLHWAGVTGAKRQERLEGRRRLSEILGWAERAGKVPLSPASVREGTGLRRGIFVPLGPPDLPPPWSPRGAMRGTSSGGRHRPAVEDFDPVEYGEAALAGVEQVRPRLDLTLSAFLFNEDALRLFGGLVGEKPRPSDLARMDKILRELVSWQHLIYIPPPPPSNFP